MMYHSGYAMQQSQRPQTLGYGLTDSPVGQLAWVAEKLMSHWPDPNTPIPRDAVLTTVSPFCSRPPRPRRPARTGRGAQDGSWFAPPVPSTTPTAVAVFPNGLAGDTPIRRFAERANTIVRWTEFDRGGHFPQPRCRNC